jgi:hypothetical protein
LPVRLYAEELEPPLDGALGNARLLGHGSHRPLRGQRAPAIQGRRLRPHGPEPGRGAISSLRKVRKATELIECRAPGPGGMSPASLLI